MINILFVCHGNICRSTMAESYLNYLISQNPQIKASVHVDSAATSREEIGNPPHPGTIERLAQEGIPTSKHRARQVLKRELNSWDYIFVMDDNNLRNMQHIAGKDWMSEHVTQELDFSGEKNCQLAKLMSLVGSNRDVADPWYTGNFDATYRDISCALDALAEKLMHF